MKKTNIEVVAVQPSPSIKAVQEKSLSGLGRGKDGQNTRELMAKVVGFVQIPKDYFGPVALAEKEKQEMNRQGRREYWIYKKNLKRQKAEKVVGTKEWLSSKRPGSLVKLIAFIRNVNGMLT